MYSKRYILINLPQNVPPCSSHFPHRFCDFLQQFWKSPFRSVFSGAVLPQCPELGKRLSFILNFEKSLKFRVPDLDKKEDEETS